MASLKDWLRSTLEKEVVVPVQVPGAEKPQVKRLRARDVFLADVRILPATPLQREQDPQLRALVSVRLLTPVLDGEGRVTAYEVSPMPFRNLQIRESVSHPGAFYLRYPSISEIAYYRQETRARARRARNEKGEWQTVSEEFTVLLPVRTFSQGYALTRRQEEFLLTAYRYLRDINGWEKTSVEELPSS